MSELSISTRLHNILLATVQVSTLVIEERKFHGELSELRSRVEDLLEDLVVNFSPQNEQQLIDAEMKMDLFKASNAVLRQDLRAGVAKLEEELGAARAVRESSYAAREGMENRLRDSIKAAEYVLEDGHWSVGLLDL